MSGLIQELAGIKSHLGEVNAALLHQSSLKPHIDIINESTVLSDKDAERYVEAQQIQVSKDFFPDSGVDAVLHYIPKGAKQDPAHWWIGLFNNSDQPGVLGYHDLTNEGLPLGKVFAGTDLQVGASPSVTLSHETLEMLNNPWINRCIQFDDTTFYWDENGDPVEGDSDGYLIGNVLVSDFTLHSYGVIGSKGPWDFKGLLTGSIPTLRPQGYIGKYVFGKGWTQVFGEGLRKAGRQAMYRALPKLGSRRERLQRGRERWIRSEVEK